MVELNQQADIGIYGKRFEERSALLSAGKGSWLGSIRGDAMARFLELGFPTTKDEEWRYTNLSRLARTPFEWVDRDQVKVEPTALDPFLLDERAGHRLVFVNGYWSKSLSSPGSLSGGVTLNSLAGSLESGVPQVQAHLTRHAKYREHPFTALNTALMEDGAFLHVPQGAVVERPIHVVFVSAPDGRPVVSHPRLLVVADANSQVTVVESYVGLGSEPYFTNCVTELVAGENAVVDHYKAGMESAGSYHIGALQVHQRRSSNVSSFTITLGGGLTRNDIGTIFDGEGCVGTLNGLYMVKDREHVDNHLTVDHAKPHCDSREFFRGILDGRGRGVFSGRIIVRKDAQKTDAKQSNMTLLLSEDAQVESKPQLDIFADDVKCTHGATVGQVDGNAVFYLRSRGLSEEAARSLLVFGFARDSISQIRVEPLRERLTSLLFERLPQGHLIRESE